MKTNIEVLKENRNLVIAELTTAFSFQQVTISRLMTDFVAYVEKENEPLFEEVKSAQIFVLKNVVKYFSQEISYERNIDAINDFNEQQRKVSMQHFN